MTGTSEETGIVYVTIRNGELTDQSELISQLMQRITDMQEELQQTKHLAKLAIESNEPPLETRRFSPHFPSLSSPLPNYFPIHTTGPITSTPNPHTIDLTLTYPSVTFQIPPAYTIPEPCPSFLVQPELDHYEEMEKEWRLREEKREQEMNVMKEAISEAVKRVQTSRKITELEYEDLCMHPDLEIPEGYKIPKFETFNGIGNPMAHLRAYCDKLFNVEAVPDRYYLEKIKQKTTEDYCEYACRWRKEVAKVQPVMTEIEITSAFIRAQEPKYYERMLPMMGQKFSELIKMLEAIEDGLKTGKLTSLTALQAANKSLPSMAAGFARKKKENVSVVSFSPRSRPQRDQFVARVLIYNGSGLNICPLSTLTQLNHDVGKIRRSRMNVRAFDGSQRETMGEVDLCIQMGPAEFVTEFQVMGISTS
ncbi:uncharacterized protein [Solanum lycopersicum]|uniref:uncharacterized protein n=1 Tax=Solanum lycopersicum TaxID=4081 RepID=UPI00374A0CFB